MIAKILRMSTIAGLAVSGVVWGLSYWLAVDEFYSTNRACFRLRLESGLLRLHYDGGKDVLSLFDAEFELLGIALAMTGGGWNYFDLSLPLWLFVLAAVAGYGGLRAVPILRRRRREWRGRCLACGYDLTGNVSGRCPECGASCQAS